MNHEGKSKFVTPKVVEAWVGYCDSHARNNKAAWRAMVDDYRDGKTIGDVDWRMVWKTRPWLSRHPVPSACPKYMPLPDGWSCCNMMREVAKVKAPTPGNAGPLAGKSYVFIREGHDWTGCEVIVLERHARGCRVTRCCWMAEYFHALYEGKEPPKFKDWFARLDELC